jgi:signal transduction histidine kinase
VHDPLAIQDDEEVRVRILLVDDNRSNLIALEAALEPLGEELILASTGTEALELLAVHEFALVLMDVHMPILDGFDTVERMRKSTQLRDLPVLFLTALFRDQSSVSRGYALGAVDFIFKPVEPDVIRAKVAAFAMLYRHTERLKRQAHRLADEVAGRARAEHANRVREEFIAILGHDLRNPLGAILAAAERHGEAGAAASCVEVCRQITRSANRMSRLIDDVLDLARSSLGSGIPIARQPIDLGELAMVPIEECRATSRSEIELVTDGDVTGAWDPDRLIQVIANLVANAMKYGLRGAPIRVAVTGRTDDVILSVHNLGAPISEAKLARLFEPFQRVDDRREGLGLGLYIVAQIVRAHGGTIAATSTAADGTTFTVTLPRRGPPDAAA